MSEHIELVRAYESENYEYVLENIEDEEGSAELHLLRAKVLMNLGRYAEGLEILKGIDDGELLQRDAWLWMRTEGEMNIGDLKAINDTTYESIRMKLPGIKS